MATENKCTGLKVLDPVQGLVDYINDIKPYHTKVVEVLVEYVYGEAVDINIEEYLHTQIDMFRPEEPEFGYDCVRGYSLLPYGTPYGGWPIVPPNPALTEIEYNQYPAFNASAGSITIPGNRVDDIKVGSRIEVVTWIEDFTDPENVVTLPDPSNNFNKFFTVSQVVYNGGGIDQWDSFPDPATYRTGVEPHTVVTLSEGFGSIPALTPEQVYVGVIRLAPMEIERVYSYSNVDARFEASPPNLIQEPDEGYLRREIVGVVLSTLDGYGIAIPDTGKLIVGGNLLRSNIFVGDRLAVYDSSGNNGLYNIASLSYDGGNDETTVGVVERVRDPIADGVIQIDIPSNVFVVDGDHRSRFKQGYVFNIAGGSFSGRYTTLTSDFVDGKTRIRPTSDIINTIFGIDIIGTATGFVVRGNQTGKFASGSQVNVVGSPTNDGSYVVVSSTYDSINNETEVQVCSACTGSPVAADPVDSEAGGQIFAVQMGMIKEALFGFGESSDLCANTYGTMVRVKFHEQLTFDGLGFDAADDLIVHNMENNDSWGYELPLFTAFSSMEPTVTESTVPPAVPSLNEFWFNTSAPGVSSYARALHRFNGSDWKPAQTIYWLDTDTKLLYYRTKTPTVDTDWVLYLAEPPGFNDIQPAVGKTEIIGAETFIIEEVAPNIPQSTFTFKSLSYAISGIVDGALAGVEDYFLVDGNVLHDADGIDFTSGSRMLEVTGSGLNDGTYTISHVTFIAGDNQTRIYVEENIPTVVVSGDITIGPLVVPGVDDTLIRVTINNVPAQITLDTASQFTLISPDFNIGDVVKATVYDRTRLETNANVNQYGYSPHTIFHDNITAVGSPAHSYVLYGGDYVHRMIPQNVLEVYDVSNNTLLEKQRPQSFNVWDVDTTANTITIDGEYDWFFTPGVILSVLTSDGTLEEFTVSSGSPGVQVQGSPAQTIIPVEEDVIGRLSRIAPGHFRNAPSWDVYEIDNVTNSIIVYGDYRNAFPVGTFVKVFDSTTGNSDKLFEVDAVTYAAGNGTTVISVIDPYAPASDPIPDPDPHTTTTAIVVPANLPSYQNVYGAVYDPQVDPSVPGDNVKTYVLPTTAVHTDADAISYIWYGPLRIELAVAFENNLRTSILDGLGASNELMQVPDRYEIIETDRTANTIRIHHDDPLTGLPVDLTDSFPVGEVIRIAGSDGQFEYQTNNYQYVVNSVVWEEGTTGDTIITVETDFDKLPPYVELNVVSATNTGGPASNESQLVFDRFVGSPAFDLLNIVHQYQLDSGHTVIRFDEPIIHVWGPRNATTITRLEYDATTITLTLDTDIEDEGFTGALGFALATFIGGIYYDSTNVAVDWKDGYILREAFRIESATENLASTEITENLDFGWGTTQRWAIISTDAANNTIVVAGDISGIIDPDDDAIIIGSQGNDGMYEIESFSYAPGPDETTVVLRNPGLPVDPPAGLEGYFQLEDIDITSWYQYLIKEANSTTNVFTVYGNATLDVQSGMQFRVFGTLNDGLFTVTAPPIYDAATTTTSIQVANIDTDDNGGWIESYRDYGIRLIFEDHVGIDITENVDAVLVLTAGSMMDAFDYPYFDIGAFDEDYKTVVHLYGNTF